MDMMLSELLQDSKTLLVIVTGAFRSGKTSFIRAIRGNEPLWVQLDDQFSTEAAQIRVDDWRLLLIETPHAPSSLIWNLMYYTQRVIGHILMVDSAFPETFREAASIATTMRAYASCPYVIVANMQDKDGAYTPENVLIALQRKIWPDEYNVPCLPCVASDVESVKQVLIALLQRVLEILENTADEEIRDE